MWGRDSTRGVAEPGRPSPSVFPIATQLRQQRRSRRGFSHDEPFHAGVEPFDRLVSVRPVVQSAIVVGAGGYGIAVDASGNSYVTGLFVGTADFDPEAGVLNLTSAGQYDVFVAKCGFGGGFIHGDTNADGVCDLSDVTNLLFCIFFSSGIFSCDDAADINDDGALDISDALYKLNCLFNGGPPPPSPFPGCGPDPTADSLDCLLFQSC